MSDIGFVWDETKYEIVRATHDVSFAEVVEAMEDPMALETADPQDHDDRFMLIGATGTRVLQIIYSDEDLPIIRLITAFDANDHWRFEYERTD